MASPVKTIVATGVSSGLGFEAVKQLLETAQPYRIIIGARNTQATNAALDELEYSKSTHTVTVLPLELNNLKGVKTFSQQVLENLGQDKIDLLLLNAAISNSAEEPGPHGSQWCETMIVNHISQHYLTHLLKEKLVASKSRIVVVSSGAVRNVPDTNTLDTNLKGGSGADSRVVYCETKFVQLLGAHWWRRELAGLCDVVAVSPGLIPNTGLSRGNHSLKLTMDMPDAKPVSQGAKSILEATTRSDFPEDPDRIFLTSWGEWWQPSDIAKSLDKDLQNKWSFSKEEIERDAGISI